jgi:cytochrome c5
MRTQAGSLPAWASLPAIALFATSSIFSEPALGQHRDRQGIEVVEAVCGGCHASGKDGAPRIGDSSAWASRASQGLTALTEHALRGIRKMPAHGGNWGVTDNEISRAIVYMVNQSGANWVEPLARGTPGAVRTGEIVVEAQCAKCHQTGRNGAPMIGDLQAWTPRLTNGLERLVASAINGHGPMPARGGLPDLSREEIRDAIVYMFSYGYPLIQPQAPTAAADPYHRLVSGTDIYFGMRRADALRQAQAQTEKSGAAKVDVPSGRGYYHLNIALADNSSRIPVNDAQVTVRVSDGMSVQTKALGPVAANNAVSYGNFFRFTSGSAYNITTEIRRPGVPGTIVANFEYREP